MRWPLRGREGLDAGDNEVDDGVGEEGDDEADDAIEDGVFGLGDRGGVAARGGVLDAADDNHDDSEDADDVEDAVDDASNSCCKFGASAEGAFGGVDAGLGAAWNSAAVDDVVFEAGFIVGGLSFTCAVGCIGGGGDKCAEKCSEGDNASGDEIFKFEFVLHFPPLRRLVVVRDENKIGTTRCHN